MDIHGQSEHLSLLDPRAHLGLLDRYADSAAPLGEYRRPISKLTDVRRELNELRQAQADADRRTEMLTFQAEEIEAAKLKPGEEPTCSRSATGWRTPSRWRSTRSRRWRCWMKARPRPPRPATWSGRPRARWPGLAKIDQAQQELADQAATLEDTLADLVRSLRDYLDEIEYNPKRLDDSRRAAEPDPQPDAQVRRRHPRGAQVWRGGAQATGEHLQRRRTHRGADRGGSRAAEDAGHAGAGAFREAQGRGRQTGQEASRSNWMT